MTIQPHMFPTHTISGFTAGDKVRAKVDIIDDSLTLSDEPITMALAGELGEVESVEDDDALFVVWPNGATITCDSECVAYVDDETTTDILPRFTLV